MISKRARAILSSVGFLSLVILLLQSRNATSKRQEDLTMSDYQTAFGRSPPPNLNQWLKFAHTNNCSTSIDHYTQIYEDLGPWLQTGIISKDLKFPKYRQEQTFTFQDSAFSLPANAHNITSTVLNHLLRPIAHVLNPSKPFEFVVNFWDEPVAVPSTRNNDGYQAFDYETISEVFYKSECYHQEFDTLSFGSLLTPPTKSIRDIHSYFLGPNTFFTKNMKGPLFSQAKTKCHWDVLVPLGYHIRISRSVVTDSVPWENKSDIVFWRGSSTGGKYQKGFKWKEYPRTRLVEWGVVGSQTGNQSVGYDIGFSQFVQSDSETEQELVSLFGHPKPKVSFKDSMQFKYLVVVDGNSWPSRLQEYLQTNSVVLYTGIFIDWYSWMLVPWIHYVPVRLDFSDMDERIEWLVKNDAKARKIAENARELMKFVSRLEQMQCYTSLLLLEYQHLSK